ncbi:MAG: hypothetical protein DI537_13665 [Stutzerimonas stutzeri]|nr:MAG: hypothetical protein DI537_13665 [Stutzerimonas stutzeri]
MNITSVAYAGSDTGVVIVTKEGETWHDDVSQPPNNYVRRALAAWLSDGGEIEPFVPPVDPVPNTVTRAQALMALYRAGLLDAVESALGSHPYPPVRIWFQNALNWERGHVYLQAIGAELGLDDDQIDDLFRAAARLSS